MTGKIVKLVTDRGFGFIQPDGGDKELFFHARSVVGDKVFDDLNEGDTVSFDTEEGPKGPAATNVSAGGAAPEAEPAAEEANEEAA